MTLTPFALALCAALNLAVCDPPNVLSAEGMVSSGGFAGAVSIFHFAGWVSCYAGNDFPCPNDPWRSCELFATENEGQTKQYLCREMRP